MNIIKFIKNLNPFKKSYRVLEVKMGNNTSNFYPQQRKWVVGWEPITNRHGDDPVRFTSLDTANNHLYELYKEDRSKKVVGKTSHKFNEVFHKLSKKPRNSTGDDCEI